MQRSPFWTGALENPLNVTNPRFQETPSGPGRRSREGHELSETKVRGQPTPRPTSAFVARPLQTWLENVALVHTWLALSHRPAVYCLDSSHGSAPSLARGSTRHCTLCRPSDRPMRERQSVSIEKGLFNRYPTSHRLTDSVKAGPYSTGSCRRNPSPFSGTKGGGGVMFDLLGWNSDVDR